MEIGILLTPDLAAGGELFAAIARPILALIGSSPMGHRSDLIEEIDSSGIFTNTYRDARESASRTIDQRRHDHG